MSEKEMLKVNPNLADEVTLQQLPGIGPSLAKKIVESRPYSTSDDLEKVQGIGESVLKRIAPMLTFVESEGFPEIAAEAGIQETEMPEKKMPTLEVEAEILSPNEKSAETQKLSQAPADATKEVEEPSRPKEEKKPRLVRAFSRTETIWLLGAVGLLTLFLSVALNTIILAGINGTLNFNELQGIKQLDSDVRVLQESLKDLSLSLDALDQRLTPLEGLSGRMTVVEDLAETLQADVENALVDVEAMQSDLESLSSETTRLSGRVDRFDAFLESLRRLINEIFAAPSTEALPES